MEPFQLEAITSSGGGQTETPAQHTPSLQGTPAPGLEGHFQSAGEVSSARHFFTVRPELQAIAPQAAVMSADHSAAAALKAASDAVSPLLQLIMRLPSHVGIFGSFLEVLQNFCIPHAHILTPLMQAGFVPGADLAHTMAVNHLGQPLSTLSSHHGIDLSILSGHTHAFQNVALDTNTMSDMARLHLNPMASLKHSMNVSAGVDLQHPQFESLTGASAASDLTANSASNLTGSGDVLAGPGISAQAITPHLAPAQRIFTSKFFESTSGSHAGAGGNMLTSSQNLASNNTNTTLASLPSSINQLPTQATNDTVNAAPLGGLHAKELSFANFSASHHSVQALSGHKHLFTHHSNDGQHLATEHSHNAHDNLIKHKLSRHLAGTENHSPAADTNVSHTYRIKSGDNLWNIASKQLGDGMRWHEIYSLNASQLGSNPDLIYSGTAINLPQLDHNILPSTSDNAAIVAHQPVQSNSVHISHVQHQALQETIQHSAPKAAAAQPTLSFNFKLLPENAIVPNAHAPISMHTNINTNNGLAIENSHDKLLAGAGAAQAMDAEHGSVISRAINNLFTGKSKSAVSFSLAPDLSDFTH